MEMSRLKPMAGRSLLAAGLMGFMLSGCIDFSTPNSNPATTTSPLTGGALSQIVIGNACTPLLAGQTINVGQVCAVVNGDSLVVTYATTPGNGWTFSAYHLWVGTKTTDIPQNKQGSPVPGQFPYKKDPLSANTTTITVHVPLTALGFDPAHVCGASAIIVSHAVVSKGKQTETAYGAGNPILQKGNWATYQSVSFSGNCFVCPIFNHLAGGINYPGPYYDTVGKYAYHAPIPDPGFSITGSCDNKVFDVHPALPAGLTVDPLTCVISGIPTTPTSNQAPPGPWYKVVGQSNCDSVANVLQIFVAPAH